MPSANLNVALMVVSAEELIELVGALVASNNSIRNAGGSTRTLMFEIADPNWSLLLKLAETIPLPNFVRESLVILSLAKPF